MVNCYTEKKSLSNQQNRSGTWCQSHMLSIKHNTQLNQLFHRLKTKTQQQNVFIELRIVFT